ncbi:hypothetical protein ACQ86N_01690 [Puia sp. P3]|uniref:hypothetical protein n=1 Tax=Puia sp. P3 TaxID=3423952 RepID=UPI003D67C04D
MFYWKRRLSGDSGIGPESVWMALQRPWTLEPYAPEVQGEAIAFSADGSGYFTISEGRRPKLFYYPLKGK